MIVGSGEYSCVHLTTAPSAKQTLPRGSAIFPMMHCSYKAWKQDSMSLNPGTVTSGGMLNKEKEAVMGSCGK